jgi:hypothetical protein
MQKAEYSLITTSSLVLSGLITCSAGTEIKLAFLRVIKCLLPLLLLTAALIIPDFDSGYGVVLCELFDLCWSVCNV